MNIWSTSGSFNKVIVLWPFGTRSFTGPGVPCKGLENSHAERQAMAGPLRPLPGGVYFVRVWHGPDWEECAFTDDQSGPHHEGAVVVPDQSVLREWAHLNMTTGRWKDHWHPLRSCVVAWKDKEGQYYYRAGDPLCNHLGVPKFDLCYDPKDAFVATYDQLFHVVLAYNYFCREILEQCSRCLRAPLRLRLRRQAYKRLVLNHDIETINREHTIEWMSRNERFADTEESDQEGSDTPSTQTTLA